MINNSAIFLTMLFDNVLYQPNITFNGNKTIIDVPDTVNEYPILEPLWLYDTLHQVDECIQSYQPVDQPPIHRFLNSGVVQEAIRVHRKILQLGSLE